MRAEPHVRTETDAEVAEPKKISPGAWHEKASHALRKLLERNQMHRVLTITRAQMPGMFGALKPWSGKPEDMIGVVVKGDVMHFYQMLKYVNKEDGHQTRVVKLDNVGKGSFTRDIPEGLYQDVIDAIRKAAKAKLFKTLFNMNSQGFEELLPSKGQAWKTVVVTTSDDGSIAFHELTDHVP